MFYSQVYLFFGDISTSSPDSLHLDGTQIVTRAATPRMFMTTPRKVTKTAVKLQHGAYGNLVAI